MCLDVLVAICYANYVLDNRDFWYVLYTEITTLARREAIAMGLPNSISAVGRVCVSEKTVFSVFIAKKKTHTHIFFFGVTRRLAADFVCSIWLLAKRGERVGGVLAGAFFACVVHLGAVFLDWVGGL